jgi:DNA-binding YbaB/EbfC family protein
MDINPMELLKNASAVKEQFEAMRSQLTSVSATGNAGGNIVRVTVNGRLEMTAIELDPIAVDPRDIDMLQDLIVAAHTDALEKVQAAVRAKAGPLLNGINLAGLGK